MPAENDFEGAMRRKMEELQLPPYPGDWQCVHDALHPKKGRRAMWWWPFLAIMVAMTGYGIWKWQGPAAVAADEKVVPFEALVVQDHPEEVVVPNSPLEKKSSENRQPSEATPSTQSENVIVRPSSKQQVSGMPAENAKSSTGSDERIASSFPSEQHHESYREMTLAVQSGVTAVQMGIDDMTIAVANDYSLVQKENDTSPPPLNSLYYLKPGAFTIVVPPPLHYRENPLAMKLPGMPGTMTSTQVIKKGRWQPMVWLGAGMALPGEGISLGAAKALDRNSGGQGGLNSFTIGTNTYSNGFHGSAGLLLDRTFGQRWRVSFGTGLALSNWQESGEWYKDSLRANGSLYSRTLEASYERQYSRVVLQVPLYLSGRIGKAKTNSIWWSAGLQNQWLLQVNRHQQINVNIPSPVTGAGADIDQRKGKSYLPAFSPGLMLDHAGRKYHWQLLPQVNLPLGKSFKDNNTSGDSFLTTWELQWRWAF